MTDATLTPAPAGRSYARMILRRFLTHKMAVFGGIVVVLL